MGYKAGMEVPMLETYFVKLEKQGFVERTGQSLKNWYVAPKPVDEEE
jgi:hypothetical protein